MHWEFLCYCCSCPLWPAGISRQMFSNLVVSVSLLSTMRETSCRNGTWSSHSVFCIQLFYFCSLGLINVAGTGLDGCVIVCCVISCGCWRDHQCSVHTCPQQKLWNMRGNFMKREEEIPISVLMEPQLPPLLQTVVKRLLLLLILVC